MMFKISLLFVVILLHFNCKSQTKLIDYFGEAHPDSIPVVFAPEIISKQGRLEHGISFSPDIQELAFGVLDKENFSGEIFFARKNNKTWSRPSVFEPSKNQSAYLPYFTPDGRSLLYAQSKDGAETFETDIWIAEKNKDGWGNPRILPSPINSKYREANASMTSDGTIYFSSNRVLEGTENSPTADLFVARQRDNEYQKVDVISKFMSSSDEESVFIAPNEDYIIFCRYTNDDSKADLYISYRDIDENWIEPQLVDSTINSSDWDRRPFVSMDNKFLFFTRLTITEEGLTESDIFWVNTSKLFKPFVYHSIPEIEIKAGEQFDMVLPEDYFKDIDDQELIYTIDNNSCDWLDFDSTQMKLSGLPRLEGRFKLIFKAIDQSFNITEDKITIIVKK